MHYTCILCYSMFFWRLHEINLAQASQYESTDEHDHGGIQILSDLIILEKNEWVGSSSFGDILSCFTADERQPWTNYENNGCVVDYWSRCSF